MRFLFIIFLYLFLSSCQRGVWVNPTVYRPKKPKFSITEESFSGNIFIDTSFIYISINKFQNYDGRFLEGFIGFYSDGRVIANNAWTTEKHKINERNSWHTAASIGYYNTSFDKIKIQVFYPDNGGQYLLRNGIIKKDTIILVRTIRLLGRKELRSDTLVKSNYVLQ